MRGRVNKPMRAPSSRRRPAQTDRGGVDDAALRPACARSSTLPYSFNLDLHKNPVKPPMMATAEESIAALEKIDKIDDQVDEQGRRLRQSRL